jgi:hypothetical protein
MDSDKDWRAGDVVCGVGSAWIAVLIQESCFWHEGKNLLDNRRADLRGGGYCVIHSGAGVDVAIFYISS